MKKYLVPGILALLLVLALLAGCAGPAPTQAPSQTPTTSSSATPTTSAAPTQSAAPKTSAVAPASKITLKFSTWMPVGTGHPDMVMAQWLFDEIKKNTNGQVEFQVFPSNQLATQVENIDGIKNGLFDCAHYIASTSPSKTPLWFVEWQPLAFTDDPTITMKTKRELAKLPFMQAELAAWGANYFWGCASGPRIIMSKKDLKGVADLKGLKIRSAGGEANVLQSLGATPVTITSDAMYDALQKGTIEAATSPYENLVSYGVSEVTKYAWMINIGMGSPILVFGQKSWANLPADLQKIITDTTIKGDTYYGDYIKDRLSKALTEAKKTGKQTFVDCTPEEQKKWNDAAITYMATWIKAQDDKKLAGTDTFNSWKSIQEKLISAK